MKKDVFLFSVGVTMGYCLVQGFTYLHQHYLWALFYR